MSTITTDKSFARVCPKLSDEELSQLEANILADGCLQPVDVWKRPDGKLILIDGHHRVFLCRKHGIKFKVRAHQFENRLAATIWAREQQLGRRNLTDSEKRYQIGELYNSRKLLQGRQAIKPGTVPGLEKRGETAAKIAAEQGVDERTVRRAGEFADTVNAVAEKSTIIADAVRSEDFPASQSTLEAIASASPRNVKRIEKAIESGDTAKVRDAVAIAREAGDDTEAEAAAKKANAAKRSNNGKEKFPLADQKEAEKCVGRLFNISDRWGFTRAVEKGLRLYMDTLRATRQGK